MSTTRLVILGLVKWLQPVHGYDLRRELRNWHVEEWTPLAAGSIYHALRALTAEGLLSPAGTEQVGSRPARTTYRLTEAGEASFSDLMHRYWWSYEAPIDPFLAGFAFLPALSRREVSAALRNRARLVRADIDKRRFALASEWMRQSKPAHVGWIFELILARLEAEVAWCEQLATRVDGGATVLPPGFSFPGGDGVPFDQS